MNKIKIMTSLLMMACLVTWLVGTTTDAGVTTPGTVEDPIVTKSYVDKKDMEIEQRLNLLESGQSQGVEDTTTPTIGSSADGVDIESYIDEQVALAIKELDLTQVDIGVEDVADGTSTALFTVVEATKGQRIICGASAELILRAGTAKVVSGENGDGLADLTSGEDLAGDDVIPSQHHLLVSRDDGRGIEITSEDVAYILVKGAYKVDEVE